jgi:hypothetical protein
MNISHIVFNTFYDISDDFYQPPEVHIAKGPGSWPAVYRHAPHPSYQKHKKHNYTHKFPSILETYDPPTHNIH